MDLLKAVNRILPVLGEHPVTAITDRSATLAVLLPKIDAQLDDLTMSGWWFNTYEPTLYPDTEGIIAIPDNTLSFCPADYPGVVRADKLFNTETISYVWTTPVKGILIARLPFHELPESMASHVLYASLVDVYVTDIGMEDNVQMWARLAANAEARALSEHLRNMKYSTANSPRWAKRRLAMKA